MAPSPYHSLRDPLKCKSDYVTPLLKASHHIRNTIQNSMEVCQALQNLTLLSSLISPCIWMPRSVPQNLATSVSFCISVSTSIAPGTCQTYSCLRAFALVPCGFSILPYLPVTDSIMSFRFKFRRSLPSQLSHHSLSFLKNYITIWNVLIFYILSPILGIKLWENGDLVCPFHCIVGECWLNE